MPGIRLGRLMGRRGMAIVGGAILSLALGAWIAASIAPSGAGSAVPSTSLAGAGSGTPTASQAGTARCQLTPAVSPKAAIQLKHLAYGPEVTIDAGQAVAFTNLDNQTHTLTEGTFGTAVTGACVNSLIASGRQLVVTFKQPGHYAITCRRHPSMHTVVHVIGPQG